MSQDSAPADTAPEVETGCLGRDDLCALRLDQVTLAGTHNAMSNSDEGWLGPNQTHSPAQQLEDGIRAMMLDTYEKNGELWLCHSVCALGSEPLAHVLDDLASFLVAHPTQLVLIIFQDAISVSQTLGAIEDAGLSDLLIERPADGEAWPTLGALVEANTRLLITRESGEPGPANYPSFWSIGWDTPYSFSSEDDFSCEENRGSTENDLFLMNHWLSTPLPTRSGAERVNTEAVLGARAAACTEAAGRRPNIVAVDFYETGGLFDVVDALNDAAVAELAQ